jgi:3-hydroxyisobutyrate dehydrogenase-like beta-hydroxyacid dehydrogenase
VTTVCVLFPGEMGSALARALIENGHRVVSFVEDRSPTTRRAAMAAGILPAPSLEEALASCGLVVSLVPQQYVLPTAEACAQAVRASGGNPLFVDANSSAPQTVARVAATVRVAGMDCVDGVFLGTAAMLGDKTTLYLSGPRAHEAAVVLGTSVRVVVLGAECGRASALKLSFAAFNKGLVALLLEVLTAADRAGLREELSERLLEFYPGTIETFERLLPSYPRHVARRVEELDEAAAWLESIGQCASMAAAAAAVLRSFADLGLPTASSWDAAAVVEECCRRRFLSCDETDSPSA